jgi:4-aminobutyrate aminotransferase-like enzyme
MTAEAVRPLGPLSPLDESRLIDPRLRLHRAENATLYLRSGDGAEHVCTDFCSAYAAVNFGHANPAIGRGLDARADLSAFFYPEDADAVAEWLIRAVSPAAGPAANGTAASPAEPRRTLFQIGGSFAVSSALALARANRPGRIAAVRGAFHGLGIDTQAVSSVQRDLALQGGLAELLEPQVLWLDPDGPAPDWDGVCCFLFEPIQGANGYRPLDPEWLAVLVKSARAAGVVVVCDEIQAGFYRHGRLSPSTALGLDADVVLFSKALTNGLYPLSAVVYKQWLEAPLAPGARLSHTFQTATLGYAIARDVTRYLDVAPVREMAVSLQEKLEQTADALAEAGAARAIHVPGATLSFEPTARPAREVVAAAFRAGVLAFAGGAAGERIRIAPPLTIPGEQLDAGLRVLRDAVLGTS